MKHTFFKVFTLSLIFLSQILYAQDNKWSVDISVIKNEYRGGTDTNGFLKFGDNSYIGVGLGLNRDVSPTFEGSLQLSYGSYGYQGIFLSDNRFDGSMQLRLKLNNGVILPEDSKIAPFFYTGVGITSMSSNKSESNTSYFFPIGMGVKYALSSSVMLQYHFSFNLTNEDKADGAIDVPISKGDNFIKHSLGFVIVLGGASGVKGGGYYYKNRKRR